VPQKWTADGTAATRSGMLTASRLQRTGKGGTVV